jgi:ribosomal protein S18 acetylase RimI-like enzyme
MKPWERNAANLAASLAFYGPVEQRAGLRLITSRVSFSVFNIALLDAEVPDPFHPAVCELDRRLETAGEHYSARNREWSVWVCEHLLGQQTSRRLMKICEAHGLNCIAESPGMEADDFPPRRRALPELVYRLASDRATRRDFAHIVTACFHIPATISAIIYEHDEPWQTPLDIWLGYRDGQAVTSAAVIPAAGGLGIYSVATLPAWRGRGYAEAVMRHAVEDQRAKGVAGPLVLQSSPAGLDLYRKLGFRRVTRYFVFSTA